MMNHVERRPGDQPIVAITMGDAAGIGPEVIAKALRDPAVGRCCRPLVIGDARVFEDPRFAAVCDLSPVGDLAALRGAPHRPAGDGWILDQGTLDPASIEVGSVSAQAGRAAVAAVVRAANLALDGAIDAIATAPLHKEAIRLAGCEAIGHTEILADVTGAAHATTMLATEGLQVTHVTRHIPFREIADRITQDRVLGTIQVTADGMRAMGFSAPRLAVAGLNPHNGEHGLLGREELDAIGPAVEAARARGIDATGPIPADSVFFQAIRGDYDAVVTMYHDQGHIAVKTHGFEGSITITLGLPIIRTSADHGTAFDIAGRGEANPRSMIAAIVEAAHMANHELRGR
jgi:4-hydroxythreonine-4-phosphate dehydrogenase